MAIVTTLLFSDEMLSYARNGRAQTLSALKRESAKERQRIFEKINRGRRENADISVLPSFLVERKASSSERLVFYLDTL